MQCLHPLVHLYDNKIPPETGFGMYNLSTLVSLPADCAVSILFVVAVVGEELCSPKPSI